MDESQRKNLTDLIEGLELLKLSLRDGDESNITEINGKRIVKARGMCSAVENLFLADLISTHVANMIRSIIAEGVGDYTWFNQTVAKMNNWPSWMTAQEGYKYRVMWINQLIRDYKRMLRNGKVPKL